MNKKHIEAMKKTLRQRAYIAKVEADFCDGLVGRFIAEEIERKRKSMSYRMILKILREIRETKFKASEWYSKELMALHRERK